MTTKEIYSFIYEDFKYMLGSGGVEFGQEQKKTFKRLKKKNLAPMKKHFEKHGNLNGYQYI